MVRLTDLLSRFARRLSHRTPKSAIRSLHSAIRSRHLFLEPLEPRKVLSTFTVVNTDDSGAGSLRQAIVDSEANVGPDLIDFNIPGAGVHTIAPLTFFPGFNDIVTIDATTQEGFDPFGLHPIELSGENLPDVANSLLGTGGGSTIRGLTINRAVIGLAPGNGSRIESNYIGLDPSGTTAVPRAADFNVYGIVLNCSNCVVGGTDPAQRNVIAGWQAGIVSGAGFTNNRIIGNYIGYDKDGVNTIPASVFMFSSANQIGEPGAGNLIERLSLYGDLSVNSTIQGNTIEVVTLNHNTSGNLIGGSQPGAGNRIGGVSLTDGVSGNKVQGNSIFNVIIDSSGGRGASHHNLVGSDGDGVDDEAEANVISGGESNDKWGVDINDSDYNEIRGNFIGVSPTGTILAHAPFGNMGFGVGVRGGGEFNRIEDNVIGGWPIGVRMYDGDSNVIAGNRIGTNQQGTLPLPNQVGVELGGTNSHLERNVISGNIKWGVNALAGPNFITGNYIGTTLDGLSPLGNNVGILMGSEVTIGGTDPADANVISGNIQDGIASYYASGAVVQGNLIGVDKTGAGPLGNGRDGIWLNTTMGNTIGAGVGETDVAAAGNVIAHNGRSGITVSQGERQIAGFEPAYENRIRGNAIYANGGLGIDLATSPFTFSADDPVPELGVTANDSLDVDDGPNRYQNFPTLIAASSAASTRVQGELHSTPSSTFTLDFYANSTVDPSGYGEGERWLGSASVNTDANGNAIFNVVIPAASNAGEFITSTATDSLGNTSEFSQAVQSVLGVKTVTIDVQSESLNLDSNGAITVVIYSASDFNAAQVNVRSVVFAGAHAWQSTLVDANHDGLLDLQLKFRRQDTVLNQIYAQLLIDDQDADGVLDSTRQTAEIDLTGELVDHSLFSGFDSVTLFLSGKKLRDLLGTLFA